MIEFVLIIPLVFLLAVNAVNFAGFIFVWITVANAARDGPQYLLLSSTSPAQMTPATLTQVAALMTFDVNSLLNRSSVVVALRPTLQRFPKKPTRLKSTWSERSEKR